MDAMAECDTHTGARPQLIGSRIIPYDVPESTVRGEIMALPERPDENSGNARPEDIL
jgi:hypothetical protein